MKKKIVKQIIQMFRLFRLHLKHIFVQGSIKDSYQQKKKIVFCVNGWGHHGGWTDRLKGIISCYDFAISNGYSFRLWYNFPCNLDSVLYPNFNWKCNTHDKKFNLFKDKIFYLNDQKNFPLHQLFKKNKLSSSKNFIYFNIDTTKDSQRWSNCYHELFLPNEKVNKLISDQLNNNSKNIAFVFRFLHKLGDFKLVRREGLSEQKVDHLINHYIKKVENYYNENIVNNENVYVFSDSDLFLKRLVKHLPHLKNLNPDKRDFIHYHNQTKQKGHQILERTLFDFSFLSSCDEIHHFIEKKYLYPSGFPKYASYLAKNTKYIKVNAQEIKV